MGSVRSLECLLAEPLVDLTIGSLPETRVRDEVVKEMDDKPRDWLEHLLLEKIGAEVPARQKEKDAKAPIGSVPRPLRNDARPARRGDPLACRQ